jgi:hypothetical protein
MERLADKNNELSQRLKQTQQPLYVSHSKRNNRTHEYNSKEMNEQKLNDPSTHLLHWQSNFIQVFMDLMYKLGRREGFAINPSHSDKRKLKACWRYLKQFIRFYHVD